ncbi:hypothetical protein [Streptomyces lavendulae]|uniref:hypothetical protein n=1 Tax=Streptomyces lavendulae TaxID=1914 RepID=UPI0031E7BE64
MAVLSDVRAYGVDRAQCHHVTEDGFVRWPGRVAEHRDECLLILVPEVHADPLSSVRDRDRGRGQLMDSDLGVVLVERILAGFLPARGESFRNIVVQRTGA